jgi:hypothetical protein
MDANQKELDIIKNYMKPIYEMIHYSTGYELKEYSLQRKTNTILECVVDLLRTKLIVFRFDIHYGFITVTMTEINGSVSISGKLEDLPAIRISEKIAELIDLEAKRLTMAYSIKIKPLEAFNIKMRELIQKERNNE